MNKTVAIIGGGIIGGGWAARFRLNGWDAKIYDTDHQAVRKISEIVLKAPIFAPILIIRKTSSAGKPINIKKNEFICLLQNYIINVYLSNNE